jgi:hypothetical protein
METKMENENTKNYPFGRKEASGFITRIDTSAPNEMPPGILGPIGPRDRGKSSPYMPSEDRRRDPRR